MTDQTDFSTISGQVTQRHEGRRGLLRTVAGAILFFLGMVLFVAGCDSSGGDGNENLSANYTATASEDAPLTYTFDASGSSASGGEIVAYEWDFDDGSEDSLQTPTTTHTFDVEDSTRFAVALTIIDGEGDMDTEMKAMTVAPPPAPTMIPKSDWELVDFSSENAVNDEYDVGNGHAASNIIDGDIDTFWHSRFDPERVSYPQYLTVDMGESHEVAAFEFVHREAGNRGGSTRVRDIRLEASDDGENFESLGEFTLEDTRDPQMIELDSAESFRYFKINVLSSQGNFAEGNILATLAEVSAFQQ